MDTTGVYPIDIAIGPRAGATYVANAGSDTVTLIRGPDTESISAGEQPIDVEVDPERGFAYVANVGSNNVSIIYDGEVRRHGPCRISKSYRHQSAYRTCLCGRSIDQ